MRAGRSLSNKTVRAGHGHCHLTSTWATTCPRNCASRIVHLTKDNGWTDTLQPREGRLTLPNTEMMVRRYRADHAAKLESAVSRRFLNTKSAVFYGTLAFDACIISGFQMWRKFHPSPGQRSAFSNPCEAGNLCRASVRLPGLRPVHEARAVRAAAGATGIRHRSAVTRAASAHAQDTRWLAIGGRALACRRAVHAC